MAELDITVANHAIHDSAIHVMRSSDREQPSILDAKKLKLYMKQGTDFIFIAQNRTGGQLESLHGTEISSQQGTSAIHDGNVPSPLPSSKPSSH